MRGKYLSFSFNYVATCQNTSFLSCFSDLASYIPTMKKACHEYWKHEYLAKKAPTTTIPRKRTLLEAFLHNDPVTQSGDEFEQ